MVALLVLPISLSAGAKALRLFDSSNIENGLVVVNRNTFLFSSIEGQINALPDDTTAVVCPDDISIYTDLNSCDALITSGLSIEDPDNVITSLTWIMEGATTGQSPASGVNQINSSVFNEGTTIITYKGSTRYNNSINCSFTVTVSDNQVPKLIYGPGNTTVSNGSNECYAQVRWTEPIVSDNCVAEDNVIIQSNHISGETFPVGVTEVEYRISDGINELIHRFTVTVKDDVAPMLTAPEPMTVVCGEEIEDAFTSWNQFQQAGGKVSDNCAINYNSFRYVSQTASGIRCPYTITRTYSIEDVNGNLSEVKRYIQVTGDEPEEIQEAQEKSGVILKSGMNVITSTGTGGDWNNGSTWVGGVVPQPTDDVIIASGATVTISGDQTCNNITINGTLEFSGSHTLNVTGSWTNDGNFNADSGTVQFSGSGSNSIGGGSTTVFKNFILDKGTVSDILNVNSDVVLDGAITFTSGLFQINSGNEVTCTGNSGFTVEALAGIYVNGGTFTGGSFSVAFKGLFQIDSGIASFGDISGNSILTQSSGTFDVNGGVLNVAGRLEISGGTADISGGTVNLSQVGHNSSTIATLDLSLASDFNMTAGTINFLHPNGSGYFDIEIENGVGGNKSISGGTFNFGDGSVDTYRILTDIDLSGSATTTANNTELEITQNVDSDGTYIFDLSDGNGNIIPVTITINASSYGSNASIVVTTTDGKFGDNASSANYLSRYWTVVLTDISSPNYSITVEYPSTDVSGSESEIAAGVWTGSLPWMKGNAANGGGNTISASGLTASSIELTGITLDAPTVEINGGAANEEICDGSSVVLTAVPTGDPGWTYSWSPSTGLSATNIANPTADPTSTTTYEVTVTDGNGFTASDDIEVIVNPIPDVTPSPADQTICSGTQTSISLSGAVPGTTFSWIVSSSGVSGASGGSGTSIAQALTATGTSPGTATYTITPTANGCTGSSVNVIITVNPTPSVDDPGDQSLCHNENASAVTFSGTATSYNWTNNNTSIGLAANGTGNIAPFTATNTGSTSQVATITVTPVYSNNGVDCSGTQEIFTITVNPIPTVSASPPTQQICPGGTIAQINISNPNSVAGTTFSWTRNNTSVLTGINASGSGSTISGTLNSTNPGVFETTTFTITTTANGCSSQTTVDVVVGDDVIPTVASCPSDISVGTDGGSCSSVVTYSSPTFDDNCDGSGLTGTLVSGFASGQSFPVGITTVTYEFSDAAGNGPVFCSFDVTVSDDEAPVISNCPSDIIQSTDGGACEAVVSWTEPTATDHCTAAGALTWTKSHAPGATFSVGTTTVTYTATDAAGNVSTICSFDITITDNEAPEITCPSNITVDNSPGFCYATAASFTITPPIATDNCNPDPTETPSRSDGLAMNANYPVGLTTITWTASDGTNTSTCTQTITVVDSEDPTFTVPANITIYTDASCNVNRDPSQTGNPINPKDNCTALALLGINYIDGANVAGSCTGNYSFTRTWTVTDETGNTTSKNQVITVNDNTPPTFTFIPADINISCEQDTSPSALGYATATDACDNNVDISYYDVVTQGSCLGDYQIVRHWTATDDCDNSVSVSRIIDVTDLIKPVVIDNGDTTINCVVDIPNADPSVFSYYDACGTVNITLIDEIANGLDNTSGYCPYELVRTWRLTDECNNVTEFDQTITILQDENICEPCSECLYDNTFYVVDLRGNPDGDITFEDVKRQDKCCGAENVPGAQTMFCASFNVIIDEGAVGIEILIDGTTPPGQDWKKDCEEIDGGDIVCLPSGEFHLFTYCKKGVGDPQLINDYTFKSVKGLIASGDIETREDCNEVLQVTGDFSNPNWTSIYPGNPGDYNGLLSSTTDTVVYFNALPGSPSHIQYQVCGTVDASLCGVNSNGEICDTVDIYVRPAIEMDLNINPDLICQDHIPTVTPVISPAGTYDLEWYTGATPSGLPVSTGASYTPLSSGWYSVVAIDNTTGLDCNRDTFSFEMKYDLTGPTIKEPPLPLYLECNTANYAQLINDWLNSATAEYINEVGDTIRFTPSNDYYSGSGVTMTCGDSVSVIFAATDQCSNDTTAQSYIIVVDTTKPVITPSVNTVVDCNTLDKNTHPDYIDWLANHGGATATDECDPDLTWLADTSTAVWVGDGARDSITVTFTVADDCGNSDQTTATFTIVDDQPPEITCPGDVETLIAQDSCSSDIITIGLVTAIDACSIPELEWTLSGATSGSGVGQVAGTRFNVGITTVHYTAIDGAGLPDTCSFTVWVKHLDFPASSLTCPDDSVWIAASSLTCNANVALDLPVYSGTCEDEIESMWNNSPYGTPLDASGTYPVGTTEFKWYIKDVSGNIDSTCTVKVVVGDVDPPQFTNCPTDTLEDIINDVDCDMTNFTLENPTYEVGCGADLRWTLRGATNNSGTGLIDPSVVAFNVGITTITYILEDESNNADTCIYWAWAKRANFPTASITCPPASVSVPADPATCDAFVTLDTVVWTDPCNEIDSIWNNSPHRTSYDDASGTYPIGTTNFSWFILDVSGNIYNCDVAVTVTDTTSPNITGVTDIIECPEYVLTAGDTQLDLDTLLITDDCADDCSLGEYTIRWRIDFADGSSIPSGSGTYNTGLLSEYGSDILFPADSVTYTTLDHTVTYWVVDCSGNVSEPEIRTVSVYPPPTAIAPADTLSYCYADTVPAITLEGYPAGDVVFDVSGGSSLGIPDMTGVTEIPSFWATSTGTATISITPRANGCVGNPVTLVLIITEPVTVSVSPVFQTICSGETTNIHLMSSNPGATFSYEVTSVSPAGSVIGAIDSTGEYIRQTLINTTQSQVTVTYTVTAVANGCTSPGTTNATVTINPTPELIITDPDTVCEPETVDLTAAEITAGSASGLTFTYWEDAGGSVSLSNPSAINQSGTYYIRASSGAGCEAFDSVHVVINPLPELTSELNPGGICSNEWFEYVPESTIPGTEFEWTRAEVPGISNPAESGNDSIREFLVNTTLNPIAVTYQYTLIANGCPNIQEVVVVVTPTPNLTSTQTPPSICSGTTFSYTPTSDVSGTTFPWTRAAVPGISNPAASGVGNPNEVLINTTSSPIGVTYEYTLTSNDCGNPVTFPVYVIVVPSPNVTAWANPVEICPGESIDLFSTSDVVSTKDPVILTEDFNSASVGSTSGPNGWTTTNNSWGGDPSDAAWTIRQDNYNYGRTFSSNDDSQFYLSNSDAQGRRSQTRTTLVSPMMNTEGYTNLQLEFYHYYRSYSSRAYVDVSTDGSNWTTVQTYYGSDGSSTSFSHETISLNGYVGSSSFYVRFRYEADWGYYWAIDNVEISGTPVAAANVTWTSNPAGFTSTEANPTSVYPGQTTTYIVSYTDPDTDCPGYDSVTVVVRDLPDAQIVADYCAIPDKILLTASGGVSYLWSTGETTESIVVDMADIYSVLVTDAFGCQKMAYNNVSNELVVNGDFEMGPAGISTFSSDYTFKTVAQAQADGSLYPPNFGIGTDAHDYYQDFRGAYDHTKGDGTGYYMIVDGTESSYVVWEQTFTVQPNTTYYFSAWAINVYRTNGMYDPILQFSINDTLIGTQVVLDDFTNSDYNPWLNEDRFYGTWYSGTNTTAVVRIRDLQDSYYQNDFGLDDISFGTLDPLPSVVEASSNSPICEGDSIHLSMTVTNGKEPFTYNWTGPNGYTASGQNVSIPNADPSYSGDYIAVVTDGYGCGPTYDTITVVVEEAPTVDAGPDQELCAYEREVTLAGSIGGAATSATWTGGTGTFSDSTALNAIYTISDADTTAGIVTLVLTTDDPAGECGPVTDTMQIIIHPVVNAVLDTAIDPTCPGDADGEITVHGENGTEPYTYSWNTVPEQTTATANGLPAGTYTVTVTDAFGCWDTVSVTLTDPETLVVDSVTFTEPLCYNGEDGTATVHISSGTNPTIVWSNGDTTLTADSLLAGLYTVTVYAENWCSSVTIPIAVTQPDPPTVDCPEDIVVFADFGADSASNVAFEAPVYNNDCPLETQTWTLSGVTIDSSAQNVIDTLWVHDFNIGVSTVTYTFTDIVGNVSVCDFTVTVLAAPVIECPPDTTLYLDGTEGQCAATYDPGVSDLIEGVPPIEWTYTIEYADGTTVGPVTYTKDEPDQYPDPLGELDFPLGVTTIHWRAQNTAGFDTCSHWIEVLDTIPPTLTADPYENCVDPLHWAVYNEANPNPVYNHVDPLVEKFPVDYRTLFAGDEFLDLTSLEDNCCDSTEMTIHWRIEFSDTPDPVTGAAVSHSDITGTGQPSEYEVGGIPTDIYLWGDGVTFTAVTHQIYYWVEDCNGNTSEEIRAEITITPRPEVKKEGY